MVAPELAEVAEPCPLDLPVRKVIRALESIRLLHERTAGSHAVLRHPDAAVVLQHGTVKRGTLSSILRRAGLTPAEFLNLLR